jgi:hypothetical protein
MILVMLHHRITRVFLIVLCVLCAAIWAGSHFKEASVLYITPDRTRLARITCGYIDVYSLFDRSSFDGIWDFAFENSDSELRGTWYKGMEYHFGGFAFDHNPGVPTWEIVIPMWFPTLLSLLLLWLAVRKPRAKTTGGAFPVEPARPK